MGVSLGCAEEKVLGGVGVGGVSLGCAEEKVLGGVGVGGVSLGCAEKKVLGGVGVGGVSLGCAEGMVRGGHWATAIDQRQLVNSQGTDRRNGGGRRCAGYRVCLDHGAAESGTRREVGARSHYPLRCAHGDLVTYPLADLKLEVDGVVITVRAAVAERLPVSMLLGAEVAELGQLLSHHTTSQCW